MKYNIKAIKRYINKHGQDDTALALLEKNVNKKVYNKKVGVPPKSLQDDWHVLYDEDGEGWKEYGFFEAEDMTDEEINEYVEAMRVEIHSPYDCTGKAFTMWIDWHRNPCGWISVVHRLCLDV